MSIQRLNLFSLTGKEGKYPSIAYHKVKLINSRTKKEETINNIKEEEFLNMVEAPSYQH